ncbi:MAG: class I SAM-dependent methyltransferase [Firmicutes bacterium]|nr:class I SAM-dependent methyltransferase [Bacillota bacterium]
MSGERRRPGATANTPDEIVRLRRAYEGYRRGVDVLDALTRWAAAERPPRRVLDVGAGTGNWYRSLRARLGSGVRYVGVDPDPDMAEALRSLTAGDTMAEVVVVDAAALPVGEPFDWVGLHFVLPHVEDPPAIVRAALRHVDEDGLLLVAANSASHLRRWRDMQRQALEALGVGCPQDAVCVPHPTLEEIPHLAPPGFVSLRVTIRGTFSFPDAEAAMDYYQAVLWRRGLSPSEAEDPDVRQRLASHMRARIRAEIAFHGRFTVSRSSGFVAMRRQGKVADRSGNRKVAWPTAPRWEMHGAPVWEGSRANARPALAAPQLLATNRQPVGKQPPQRDGRAGRRRGRASHPPCRPGARGRT